MEKILNKEEYSILQILLNKVASKSQKETLVEFNTETLKIKFVNNPDEEKGFIERTNDFCNSIVNRLDTIDLFDGYIRGAVEQRRIDIDKSCEWMKENISAISETPSILDDYKKEMEE